MPHIAIDNDDNSIYVPKHNSSIAGPHYELSTAMQNYVKCMEVPQNLKYGIPTFDSIKLFGENFSETLDNLLSKSQKNIGPSINTMHKYGTYNLLTKNEVSQIINTLFPFVCEYFGIDPTKKMKYLDHNLAVHVDDSDITVNLCLQNDNNGAVVYFDTIPDTLFGHQKNNASISVDMSRGTLIVHKGKHPHRTTDIAMNGGNRCNIVMWFKLFDS